MQTINIQSSWLTEGWRESLGLQQRMLLGFTFLMAAWLFTSTVLQLFDPSTGVLDFGVLTVAIFGLLAGWLAVYISIWLQELLWKPFKFFRQDFHHHFHQLSSWQQSIIYFSVFFLLLYALLKGLAIVL